MPLKINMQSERALWLSDKSHAKKTTVLILSTRHKLEWLGKSFFGGLSRSGWPVGMSGGEVLPLSALIGKTQPERV